MLKVQQQRQMARSSGATALRRPSAAPVRRRALARPARHACVRPMMFQPDKQSAKAGGETGDVPRNQLEALRRMWVRRLGWCWSLCIVLGLLGTPSLEI